MIYTLCKKMIHRGQTDGMKEKLGIFMAADQITAEQYQELMALLED